VPDGAPVAIRGSAPDGPGFWFPPTVLAPVDPASPAWREEIFGPVVAVVPFDDEDEAVRLANDSPFGLGASVWSRDVRRARSLADRIEAGMVWINDATYSHGFAQTPWGGIKESGVGVTHSKFGFYEMVDKRLVAEDPGWLYDGWWYPYGEAMRRGFAGVIEAIFTPGLAGKARSLRRRWNETAPFVMDVLRRSRR
jgi:acyl-CoA reductase-like NAD-dependent aldehyde dehydrogenase